MADTSAQINIPEQTKEGRKADEILKVSIHMTCEDEQMLPVL
jgi:hypothetical protein